MSGKEDVKKWKSKKYESGDYEGYVEDLKNPPYPGWKPESYEWLEEKSVDKTFWTYPPCYWEEQVVDSSEVTTYTLEVKVLEILGRGVCPYGLKPGDTFLMDGDVLKTIKSSAPAGGFCMRALPGVQAYGLQFGGPQDYGRGDQDSFMTLRVCPETINPVIFQLKRIKHETGETSKALWADQQREWLKEKTKIESD